MKRDPILLIILLFLSLFANGQTEPLFYLNESFDDPSSRTEWKSFPADPLVKWTYRNGGYNSTPVSAFDGDTNAILQRNAFMTYTRTLISPPVNLKDAVKPMLSFAHAQYPFFFGQDEFRLLFRAGTAGEWDTILVRNEPVEEWDELFFNIDEFGSKYLVEDFYLGFCGTTNSGNGVCIDKVLIEEKGIIRKYIRNFSVQNVPHGLIPSGVRNIPVIKVYMEVFGNTDSLKLNSISFRSTGDDNSVFENNGFKLFATTGNEFRAFEKGQSTLISSSLSIASGDVTFTGIDYRLKTGRNYFWLTADIKPDRSTQGKKVDFKMVQNSIRVNNTLMPAADINPEGYCTIEESLMLDDFEGDGGWSMDPDFETATPQGFILGYTRDPDYAYSGLKSLGTDLTQNGAYQMNINSSNAYFATTPSLNMKYFFNARLHMKTWNGFDALDNATIDVSTDNGVSWKSIWINSINGLQAESKWNDLLFSDEFDAIVRKKDSVRVRFAINYSDNQFALSGWNIDNFAITGDHLDSDLGITKILSPYNDCYGSGNDTVKIIVRNYADGPSQTNIPVYFALNGKGGTRVYDTIPGPLARNDSVVFVFTRNANFPGAGDYDKFMVSIEPAGDEDTSNNYLARPIYIQRTIVPPFSENFETSGGFWRADARSSWECMQPDGSIPVIPASPTSWMESPYGGYANNDTSFVISSCYDLTHDPDLIIELKYWLEADEGKDGMNIQYTADGGNSWHIINATSYGTGWGWFTEPVVALGARGWTRNTAGWKKVKETLPAPLITQQKVQFRVFWSSDNAINARGAAFDDFKIYPAPPDIGVSQIEGFADRCQNLNPDHVTVTIKNMGIVTLRQNENIVAGFDLNNLHIAKDTFRLAADLLPGQSIQHTFDEPVDITMPGTYNLAAFTLVEDDPWFYLNNNDTLKMSFNVLPNPLTLLADTIHTRQPDTVWIRPYYNADYDYLWQDNSTGSTYDVERGGWYYVKVTAVRGNGCSAFDSSFVELLFNDVGVDSLIFPVNHCGLGVQEYLTVRIRNSGNDSIQADQKIKIAYELNGGGNIMDTLILPEKLQAGHSTLFHFDRGPVDLSDKGIYNFKIFADYSGDTIHINDTIIRNVEIYGHPTVSLGPDITVKAVSHTLDAGSGFSSYNWDNGETGRTRQITESGLYWVRVYDENQCDNFDTVNIWLKIRDIMPDGFVSPVSDCRFEPAEPVNLRVMNSGTDTVPAGQHIAVSYRLNGGAVIQESFDLAQQLLPGTSVTHIFSGDVTMNSEADYVFTAVAVISGDMRPINDTSDFAIYRYAKPEVDFGLDEIEYIQDIQFVLDAGYSPHYAYRWQDDSDEPAYNATKSDLYSVNVTDNRTGCSDGDTVMIFLVYNDIGVTSTGIPATGCTGNYNRVLVRIQNLGTSNIGKEVPIYIGCDVNGAPVILDTLVRSDNFMTGTTLNLELSGTFNISAIGANSLNFYTIYESDMKPWNDTLNWYFNALQSPVVNFGDTDGILNTDLPHEMDAGTGNKSYLWQDGSTNRTFTAYSGGAYSVTVTGQNDCQTHKTVYVNPVTRLSDNPENKAGITFYPNPGTGLIYISMESPVNGDLTVKIVNNNGQAVFAGNYTTDQLKYESINVQYLPSGMYFILIYTKTLIYQAKMIIQ